MPRVNPSTQNIDGNEDYVYFGRYLHWSGFVGGVFMHETEDNTYEDEARPILWRVMSADVAGKKAILLSHYTLDTNKYEDTSGSSVWNTSSMRAFLNSTSADVTTYHRNRMTTNNIPGFLHTSRFTVSELNAMVTPSPDNEDSSKMTLPSSADLDGRWFISGSDTSRQAGYVNQLGGNEPYWTRSPCGTGQAQIVNNDGFIGGGGDVEEALGVRPAFFLNLESVIFKSGSGSTGTAGKFENPYALYMDDSGTKDLLYAIADNATTLRIKTNNLVGTRLAHAYNDAATNKADSFNVADFEVSSTTISAVNINASGDIVLTCGSVESGTSTVKYVHATVNEAIGLVGTGVAISADAFSSGGIIAYAPLALTTTTLTDATQNSSYSQALSGSGGNSPVFSLLSGSLPAGLLLSPSGEISGTPTVSGAFDITIRFADSGQFIDRAFSLTVNPSSGGGPGGGGGGTDDTKTPIKIDGDDIESVSVSGNTLTISWLEDGKQNTTYDLTKNSVTITYDAGRFTVALTPGGELVVTGDGALLPDGMIVVLTATDAADTGVARTGESDRAAHRRGASYALGEVKAAITGGKCVFTFPAEQIAKLPQGIYDLTFTTKSGANPAFSGTFASGYVHKISEPEAPEIALTLSETSTGGGVQASATVTSGDAPQAGIAVSFTLTGANNATLATEQKTTGADGKIATFTLKSGLTNATYTVTVSATGYATVSKTVTVSNAPTNGGNEEEEETTSGGGGCDGGFGLAFMLMFGFVGAATRRPCSPTQRK